MTQKLDLGQWLTKQQASEAIGVSSKTVEKLATEGKLQSAKRPQPGRPDAAVYHPDDVQRAAEERRKQPGAFVVQRAVSELPEALPERFSKPMGEFYQHAAEALREVFRKPSQTLFLSVKEASEVTGLTQRYIHEQIEQGTLQAIQDGRRTRIRRKDLEEL